MFVRRLRKGLGKYKGKLSFKCFNYGMVGNFYSKCPNIYNREHDDDHDNYDKRSYKSEMVRRTLNSLRARGTCIVKRKLVQMKITMKE